MDITGGHELRVSGGVESSDEQQWLELDCCRPKNRGRTVLCSETKWATSSKTDCSLKHSLCVCVRVCLYVFINATFGTRVPQDYV